MFWTGAHHGFAVSACFVNKRSVVITQRAFRRHFNIPRNNAVPYETFFPLPDSSNCLTQNWIFSPLGTALLRDTKKYWRNDLGVVVSTDRLFSKYARPVTMANKYLVMAMDYFSKWPDVVPTSNQEATREYYIYTYQGRNFESDI